MLSEKIVGGGGAFISTGFDNWKKARECFMTHEKSAVHKETLLKIVLVKRPSVATQLNSQILQQQSLNRKMLLKEISSLRFQGLALRGHDE